MADVDVSDLPNPDDSAAAWWRDEPAYFAWWRRGQNAENPGDFWREHRLLARYAHAVPSLGALDALRQLEPLLEIGAGAGYWARLLRDRGTDIVAVDPCPVQFNSWVQRAEAWTTVERAGNEAVRWHPDRAVFVCWPARPGGFMRQILADGAGRTIALITDALPSRYDDLHDQLTAGWLQSRRVALPTWPYRGDHLSIWTPR